MSDQPPIQLKLPNTVVTVSDLRHLIKEADRIDNFMAQAKLKAASHMQFPKLSKNLDETARLNDIDLLQDASRGQLRQALDNLENEAVVIHMSFASEASPKALNRLIQWWRSQVHPLVLLTVGLQPGMAAGCIIRTPNKRFDFSLKNNLTAQRDALLSQIEGGKLEADQQQETQVNTLQEASSGE